MKEKIIRRKAITISMWFIATACYWIGILAHPTLTIGGKDGKIKVGIGAGNRRVGNSYDDFEEES